MMTTPTSRTQPLILVADDDQGIRTLTRAALEQAGCLVEEAVDGQQALEHFTRLAPDLVLLDVRMPRLDGFETCHAIRHLPGGRHTPVLIMTGLDDTESIERAYDMGATDFIAKPWQVLVLTNRIRYMLRAGRVLTALQESQQHLARAQRVARLGSWTWTLATNHWAMSDEAYRMFGLSLGQFANTRQAYLSMVHAQDLDAVQRSAEQARQGARTYSLDYRVIRPDGAERIVTEQAEAVTDESGATVITGIVQDITELRTAEARVYVTTYYDPITELPNRRLCHDRLAKAMDLAAHRGREGAVLLLNLDQFRRINDGSGMSRGDDVLHVIGQRIHQTLRKVDAPLKLASQDDGAMVARWLGDTFAMVLPYGGAERDPATVARRVLAAIHRPIAVGDEEVTLTASIGIARFPTDGATVDSVIAHADSALQRAKSNGSNRVEQFVRAMHHEAADRHQLEQDLRLALERKELRLYYQPQVDIKRWAITAVEAFVRWQHPTRGIILPNQFMQIAEQSALGIALSEWVIRTACAQQRAWRAEGIAPIRMSVNLSDFHVKQPSLVEIVHLAAQDIGPSPDYLELEMTEGALMHDPAYSLQLLKRLKSLGVRIAVDDFGAGSSSLRELTHLPIDTIKIAPEFLHADGEQGADSWMTAAVIGLGHGLRCRVVGKRVETQAQLDALARLGCDDMQGHLYGAAESPARIAQLLLSKSARRPLAA